MSKYLKMEDIKNALIELARSDKWLGRETTTNIIEALFSLSTTEVDEKYVSRWINNNYEAICQSEWYENCFDGEVMDDIEAEFFIETYLIPLIEKSVESDLGCSIDARALLI